MRQITRIILYVSLATLLNSCSTTPATFYLLSPIPHTRTAPLPHHHINVGLGPLDVAKYIDQPQIVTRNYKNQLELDEYHRWSSPLEDNITQVLTENLSYLLPNANIIEYPWQSNVTVSYQIDINIWRLDTTQDGDSVLKINWSIRTANGKKILLKKTSIYRSTLATPINYKAFAADMSRKLAHFSRDVAKVLRRGRRTSKTQELKKWK